LPRASTPWWQQATALVSLTAGGAITGFSFVPQATVDFSSPTSLPVNLLALQHSVRQAAPASDATLRTAIVNVAQHYLQLAQDKTPAEMEAMIWQQDSLDHADHGPSCAAFASLTLELAAKVVGQQSWVTGGSSYPWPLHTWADVRVDENPASPGIMSIQQDAEQHGRWHPLGDGYQPQPGDWVLFNGHVEVVTGDAHGVLHTIGGDSLPNFSVNAHQYANPLASQGVAGFVNNGSLGPDTPAAASTPGARHADRGRSHAGGQAGAGAAVGQAAIPGSGPASPADSGTQHGRAAASGHRAHRAARQAQADAAAGLAAIPGSAPADSTGPRAGAHQHAHPAAGQPALADAPGGQADIPGATGPATGHHRQHHGSGPGTPGGADLAADSGGAAIPGLPAAGQHDSAGAAHGASGAGQHRAHASTPSVAAAASQQAFIDAVAPGAIASQRRYGVPAAVTIAQAIEESNWGHSLLASKDYNLFGMKGSGPAGSDALPTTEYQNGQWVSTTAPFRVYHNFAESIDDHGRLLAGSGYYQQAMAVRRAPNAFASALTGVYATDPSYGAKLISLMQKYDLYQYDAGSSPGPASGTPANHPSPRPSHSTPPTPARSSTPPAPTRSTAPKPTAKPSGTAVPTPSGTPVPTPSASSTGQPTPTPTTGHSSAAAPSRSATHSAPTPAPTQSATQASPSATAAPGQATIPGVPAAAAPAHPASAAPRPSARAVTRADRVAPRHRPAAHPAAQAAALTAQQMPLRASQPARAGSSRRTWTTLRRYRPEIPPSVHTAFLASAKVPLRREEPLYREVAAHADIPWKVLAAADWMQCEARAAYSPVHGEKLGAVNPDGTCYTTRSAGLEQAADDLRDLAWSVYQIDLTERRPLSVGDLASVFAAFRWGRLLVVHRTSALEFPYSVAGLTAAHLHMRWPKIDEPDAPDKPGTRFRRPFGAVPIVLGLGYPAVV
jgi:flagellum-specific peptidoglycan hydrolase FlgJ